MTGLMLASALRGAIVIALALLAGQCLERRSATLRHWILTAAIVAAGAMPLIQLVAPAWPLPQRIGAAVIDTMPAAAVSGDPRSIAAAPLARSSTADSPAMPVARMLLVAWVAGLSAVLLTLLAAFVRLRRLVTRCVPVTVATWNEQLADLCSQVGVHRPISLLQSSQPCVLVTWGARRPTIVLPAGSDNWPVDRIRVVLLHELSHIRRGDWAVQLVAGVVRAVYWFNPLVWIAYDRLRLESERACDDEVLGLGVGGTDYATHLLDVARAVQHPAWMPALGMARPSSLQRRVTAMLNPALDRRPFPRSLRIATAAAVLATAIAAAGSGAAAQAIGAPLSGLFVDALNNAIPNVALKLTNTTTGEVFTIRSASDGSFAFDSLPDGDYRGEATAPGYSQTHPFFRIARGQAVVQPKVIPLPLASIEETVTVTTAATQVVVTPNAAQAAALARAQAFRQRDPNAAIAPPSKTRDVRPMFPQNHREEQATVFLEGLIDSNGLMKGLQVLQPANADFARAAFDAVNEWQFEPTRMHGVPVDTAIHITVQFVR